LLALYDLFAVLSPCGPLKALVNLMQREDAPEMPGLLFEASLPSRNTMMITTQASSPSTGELVTSAGTTATNVDPLAAEEPHARSSGNPETLPTLQAGELTTVSSDAILDNPVEENLQVNENGDAIAHTFLQDSRLCGKIPLALALAHELPFTRPSRRPSAMGGDDFPEEQWSAEELRQLVEIVFPSDNDWRIVLHSVQRQDEETRFALIDPSGTISKIQFVDAEGSICEEDYHLTPPRSTGMIPLALARLNKLPLVHGPQPSWVRRSSEEPPPPESWTAEQLNEEVEVVFPRSGWVVVPHSRQRESEEKRYAVVRPDGSIKRIVFVIQDGRVYEDLRDKNRAADQEERKKERRSIKLGLGDFIFYSILVAKAALYSFTTFVASTIAILIGLALTLLILALQGKALPALPISIFLGVTFYFMTRYAIQPWVEEIFIQGFYV
jgi:hypothetical protein